MIHLVVYKSMYIVRSKTIFRRNDHLHEASVIQDRASRRPAPAESSTPHPSEQGQQGAADRLHAGRGCQLGQRRRRGAGRARRHRPQLTVRTVVTREQRHRRARLTQLQVERTVGHRMEPGTPDRSGQVSGDGIADGGGTKLCETERIFQELGPGIARVTLKYARNAVSERVTFTRQSCCTTAT